MWRLEILDSNKDASHVMSPWGWVQQGPFRSNLEDRWRSCWADCYCPGDPREVCAPERRRHPRPRHPGCLEVDQTKSPGPWRSDQRRGLGIFCSLLDYVQITIKFKALSGRHQPTNHQNTIQNLGYSTSWVDLKKCIPPKWRQYSQDQEWRGGSQCWWTQIAPSRLHCPLEIQSKSNYLLDGLNIQIRSCSENKYC